MISLQKQLLTVKTRKECSIFNLFLSILFMYFCSQNAYSLPQDSGKPIEISANSASLDQKTGTAVYKGNVILVQGTLKITADRITIITASDNTLEKITAIGRPAKYQQQPKIDEALTHAEGRTIIYDTRREILTLTKDARIKQPGHGVIDSQEIVYNIKKQSVEAGPTKKGSKDSKKSRVQIKIQPPKKD